jgi:hypothetical protein
VDVLRNAFQVLRRTASEVDGKVITAEVALAWALTETGQAKQAEPALRGRLVNLREGGAGWETAHTESLLGGCLVELMQYEEAEKVLLHAYADLDTSPDAPVLRLRQTAGRIARLYEALGRPEKAAGWRQKEKTVLKKPIP